jgi:hypothetical protein
MAVLIHFLVEAWSFLLQCEVIWEREENPQLLYYRKRAFQRVQTFWQRGPPVEF